jgi:hypothetical protein
MMAMLLAMLAVTTVSDSYGDFLLDTQTAQGSEFFAAKYIQH